MTTETFNKAIKFLKTIRLGWFVPFILLARGENPRAQLRAIFTGVCIPVLAIAAFLLVWSVSSKRIVTKFGTVPGPAQVASAWGSLRNESRLEKIKQEDHARRLREKRVEFLGKYAGVLPELPGGAPDLGAIEQAKPALGVMAGLFDELNELLDVANKVAVAADEAEARKTAEQFKAGSSKQLAETVIQRLLPLEIAYRQRAESFRMDPKYIVASDDSEAERTAKESTRRERARELAEEQARLLIERQKVTTLATRRAMGILDSIPGATVASLRAIDRLAANLGPRLDAWYAEVEAADAAGRPNPNKVRIKMLKKSFEASPYPGKDTYTRQIATSLKTVFAGFMIASLLAIPVGVLCGLNKNLNNALNPLIQIFKPVSPLAWLPIVMIVVGALYTSKNPMFPMSFVNSAITVALCSLWPTLVNTAVGVASTDKDFLNVAKVLKLSWFKKIYKVVLPAALPLIFTGLRLSLGVGWMVLIAADMLAQNPGLGKFVWDMFQNGSSETLSMIMVAVFTIGIIGYLLDTIMLSLQQLVSFGEAV